MTTGGAEEGRGLLTVQIDGDESAPQRLLQLVRDGGEGAMLRVREWSSAFPDVPREYEIDPTEMYDALAEAERRGRRVSRELHQVRRWLDGADV